VLRRRQPLSELARRFGTAKPSWYLEQYERRLGGRRAERLRLLEIGILGGASLAMWREYLPQAEIIGIDIDPDSRRFEAELGVTVWIADQGDRFQLETLVSPFERAGEGFDIVIDDGGHQQHQVITSFEVLYPHVRQGGTYVIEDLGCAYWVEYGGHDVGEPGTSVAFLKGLQDSVHEPWTREEVPLPWGCTSAVSAEAQGRLRLDVAAVEVYPNLVFITK
jgi:demethylmacrocin O-methyltransferase